MIFTIICATLLAIILIWGKRLLRYYRRNYWQKRKVLQLECESVLGMNEPFYKKKRSFADHLLDLYQKHPEARYYGSFELNAPVIFLKDLDLIRDLCIKNFDSFHDHRGFVTEDMDPIVGRNVFSLTGDRWREIRNTLSPSFTASRLKIMLQLMTECSREFVRYIDQNPNESANIEIKDVFTRYTNDVIATTAFGLKVDSLKDPKNEFYLCCKDATAFTSNAWKLFKLVALRTFPRTMRFLGMTFLARKTDRFLKRLIIETIEAREKGGIVRSDMVQLMLQEKNKKNGIEFTMDDIIGQAFIFLQAGFDVTSSTMCSVACVLAINPEIQEKVQREIDDLINDDIEELTYESLGNLKYFDNVISEALRIYPSSPLTDRVCTKKFVLPKCKDDDKFSDYEVDIGMNIAIPIYAIHKDPKYFPEPEKCIPERFSEENKNIFNHQAYMPFGMGPRKCIGNRFVLMEIKALFVHILKKYSLRLTEKTKMPLELAKGTFSIRAENGLWMRFEERRDKKH